MDGAEERVGRGDPRRDVFLDGDKSRPGVRNSGMILIGIACGWL